jgi:HEAT repeat protein
MIVGIVSITVQLTLAIFLSTLQEEPAKRAQELIAKLRSERIEDRNEAARKLKELGRAALPALKKAASDPDPEVSRRASFLGKAIEIAETLTPVVKTVIPDLDDRLASASPHEWTEIFLTLTGAEGLSLKYPHLRREDLDPLAPMAVRGARTQEEVRAVCEAVGNRRLRSAAGEIFGLFGDRDASKRSAAVVAYITIHSESDRPRLAALQESKDPQVVELTRGFLDLNGVADLASENAKCCEMLKHEDIQSRLTGLRHLATFGRTDHAPNILPLLNDRWEEVRENAILALGNLQVRASIPDVLKLCNDREPRVRKAAVMVVGMLGGKDRQADLVRLLDHEDPGVRSEAIDMLARIGARECAPKVARLLDGRPYDQARYKAVRALTDWRVKEEAPRIVAFLTSDSEDLFTRREAARAAGVFGFRQASEAVGTFVEREAIVAGAEGFQALLQLQGRDAIPRILGGLKAENYVIRQAALEALWTQPDLGTEKAVLDRMGDAHPEVRIAAAECLLRQGSRAGAPIILEQSFSLLSLNRLRNPRIVKRLEESPGPVVEGTTREIISQIAQRIGLAIRWPEIEARQSEAMFSRYHELWRAKNWKSGWDALDDILLERVTAIVEPGEIRILARYQAEQFWKSWLAAQAHQDKK